MPASRSLIALLVGTVVFFALWMVALKPSSSSSGGAKSQQGLGAYQSAINKAHQAVATSKANDAASGNENATSGGAASSHTTARTTQPASTASSPKHVANTSAKHGAKHPAKPSSQPGPRTIADEVSTVKAAVTGHKVLALLFYNPAASDDQAVKQELASVPARKGQVVKLEIPLSDAASFTAVTQQVPLNFSPTLVIVSRSGSANEIVGYTAPFVIQQQVDAALASS